MATNAAHGPHYRTRKLNNMEAFDRLPKAIRQALANSDHNWSGAQMLHTYRAKRPKLYAGKVIKGVAAVVDVIAQGDKHKHEADAARGLVCPGQR
jgi:TRAP-type mannitol/chloroaromatic compound transport system substrate-binding protein